MVPVRWCYIVSMLLTWPGDSVVLSRYTCLVYEQGQYRARCIDLTVPEGLLACLQIPLQRLMQRLYALQLLVECCDLLVE